MYLFLLLFAESQVQLLYDGLALRQRGRGGTPLPHEDGTVKYLCEICRAHHPVYSVDVAEWLR